MSEFGERARDEARQYNYLHSGSEAASTRAEVVGDLIGERLETPQLDLLCEFLHEYDEYMGALEDRDYIGSVEITPRDVALVAWSKHGDGSFDEAVGYTEMSEDEFIVLHSNFNDMYQLGEKMVRD